jgi:superfamily II DNA/RNA helicase
MLDMGFIPDIERIFKLTPPARQTLFFSATMPPEITRLTSQFLKDPTRIEVARQATTAENIAQFVAKIPLSDPKAKRMALRALIQRGGEVESGIVFCNRKSEVDIVAKSLKVHGFDAAAIHGDLDQSVRTKTLESFRKGDLKILVASDVAARGLDIPDVSHVFNYDVPHHADDYVHRIGRTGRAGRSGQAFMLVTPADAKNLDKVLKLIGKSPEEITLEGIDWSAIKDEPRSDRRGGDRDRGGRSRERTPRGGDRQRGGERPRRGSRAESVTDVVESAPEPAPAREASPHREPPPAREDTPRPPRRDAPRKAEAERTRGERPSRNREDTDRVVGFGDDTPAFLMRPTGPKSTER